MAEFIISYAYLSKHTGQVIAVGATMRACREAAARLNYGPEDGWIERNRLACKREIDEAAR